MKMNRNDFMAFFRDDEKLNTLSNEDRLEIFATILSGSSDITAELLNKIIGDYGVTNLSVINTNNNQAKGKILLEGTSEEIKNLLALMEYSDNSLPNVTTHFALDNLWSYHDAQHKFDISKEEALALMNETLLHDSLVETTWETLEIIGNIYNHKTKDND